MINKSSIFWETDKNATLRDHLEVAFVAINCLVLLVALKVGIVANLFVAWAVYHQKSLQTSNNALLVNLAIIDILRCSVDCPLLVIIVIHTGDVQDFGLVFCSVQIASFSLICCVQLLTLACISAERYQAIAYPFKNKERRKRIMVWIPLTWLLPISISMICVVFAKDSPVYVRCRGLQIETLQSYDTFGFYILTPVWCVCLAVIVGFYGQIFMLVRAHGRKVFDKGSFSPPDKKNTEDEKQNAKESKAVDLNSGFQPVTNISDGTKPHETQGSVRDEPEKAQVDEEAQVEASTEPNDQQSTSVEMSQIADDVSERSAAGDPKVEAFFHHDVAKGSSKPSVNRERNEENCASLETSQTTDSSTQLELTGNEEIGQSDNQNATSETNSPTHEEEACSNTSERTSGSLYGEHQENLQETTLETSQNANSAAQESSQRQEDPPGAEQQKEDEEVVGAVCMMPSLAQRERGNTKKESKLAKRSGYIIFTFLIFWIPLITTVVLNHFYYRNGHLTLKVFQDLEILSVSLVCVTSLTNPIIYAAVNPQFRTEFHSLKSKIKAAFIRS